MIEVLRTKDPVRLSFAMMVLRQSGCRPVLADQFIANAEGGISAFAQRILVPTAWEAIAREALLVLDESPLPDGEGVAEGGDETDGNGDRDATDAAGRRS
jgi:hypothetical protein